MTLEGAVAEVQLGKIIDGLHESGVIWAFQEHDLDGYPDYSIWLEEYGREYRIECKNVRDSHEAYRQAREVVAYKVETQKTRTSNSDPSSRYYSVDQFEFLAVCLGKKTRNWQDFMFVQTAALERHPAFPGKLAVMQRVPLPTSEDISPWFRSLGDLVAAVRSTGS